MKGLVIAILMGSIWGPTASAAECQNSQTLDRYRLLRRLSLDLRHTLPTYEEYVALDAESDVPDALIDNMLASDAFRRAMRRHHEDLLWPTMAGVSIASASIVMRDFQIGESRVWALANANRRRTYRGSTTAFCGDYEQVDFDAQGRPVPVEVTIDGETIRQDGWVWVQPYWLGPDASPVKACAFDAQTAEQGFQTSCLSRRAPGDRGCGCGPNLRSCFVNEAGAMLVEDAREQLLRVVDEVTTGSMSYSELITTAVGYENGSLSHWRRWIAPIVAPNQTVNDGHLSDALLDESIPFTDREFRAVQRSGHHAGILTLPVYLLRFQTNRSRANRFRIAFTGQYFVPSTSEDTDGCDPNADDLTQRCTCRHCHQVLEPLAAYFAPFLEAGSAVWDESVLPVYNAACDPLENGNLGPECSRFYVTAPDAHNPGTLLTHQYADLDDPLHHRIADNILAGPVGWAHEIIDSGVFHASVVQSLWVTLMGREMILDPAHPDSELALLESLAAQFQTDDDFRALVKRLVTTDQYRRIR